LPVICRLHGDAGHAGVELKHQWAKTANITDAQIDPTGSQCLEVRVELRRNLRGLRLAPCCDRAERREAERLVVMGLVSMSLTDGITGEYYPLHGSTSFTPKPMGTPADEQVSLRSAGMLFDQPTAPGKLAAGLGRHWPDARGGFATEEKDLIVWVNEQDHLRAMAVQKDADLKAAFHRVSELTKRLDEEARKNGGEGFASSGRLGYITVAPEHLGCGLECTVTLRLPRLSRHSDFATLCTALRLKAQWRGAACDVSTGPSLGLSEEELVNRMIRSCATLVNLEEQLSQDKVIAAEIQALCSLQQSS